MKQWLNFVFILWIISSLAFCYPATLAAQEKVNTLITLTPSIGHAEGVQSVALSPDDAYAVSGSTDGSLKIWEIATGTLLRSVLAHSAPITCVAFSPSGMQAISASMDRTIKLWDAVSGRLLHTFYGHRAEVSSVVVSREGEIAISGDGEGSIILWNLKTGDRLRSFSGHRKWISGLALSTDGLRLVSASGDKTIKVWDIQTGKVLSTIRSQALIRAVALSIDGTRILSGGIDGEIVLWDASTGMLLRRFTGHKSWVNALDLAPDRKRFISASADRTLKLWNMATGESLRTFTGHGNPVMSVKFSSDGDWMLSGGEDKTARLWKTGTGRLVHVFKGLADPVEAVAVSRDGNRVLAGSADHSAKLWDAHSGTLLRVLRGHTERIFAAAYSADGSHVATGGADRTVKLWDPSTGQLLHSFEEHKGFVRSVAFSTTRPLLASGGDGGDIKIWDVRAGSLLASYDAGPSGVRSIAFSPDGSRLYAGSDDGILRAWDVSSGQLSRVFHVHSSFVTSIAVSPDGQRLLSGSFDNKVILWDAITGAIIHVFEGHVDGVKAVLFLGSGDRLASGGYDKTLKIWGVAAGRLIMNLDGHLGDITSLGSAPDGSLVFSGSTDSTVRAWSADGKQLALMIAGRDSEWLTMTPAGFFAGSRNGTRMLGVVRGLEAHSVQQVYDDLYRPDLVEENLKGDPEGKYKDEEFKLNLQKILDSGPAPEVEHLKERDARAGDTYRLTVRLTDIGGGIGDKVVWRVSDQVRAVSTARIKSGAATDKALTVTASIAVDGSRDTLVEVTAYNGSGLLATQPYQVKIDKFGATTEERPRMYVLAVGVSKYRMPDYELKLAAKDATAFGEALKKVGAGLFGADKVFVTTLLDEQVTKKGIETSFDEIAERAKLGDVFVLYLSGHGKSVAGRYYYYPQTLDFAHGQRVERDGIGQDALQAWIARIAAQKKVLIIDTCESSAATGLVRGGTSTRRTAIDQLQHATGENLIAAARQAAFEGWHGHGVLTYALLEAMNKRDGGSDDERIKVAGLASFIDERVPEISQELTGLYQKPTYRLSGSDFPIGIREAVLTTDSAISSTPTHVLIRSTRVLEQAAANAQGERELPPGTQVRVLKFEGAWALIARDGQKLGYVPAEAVVKLQ